MTDQDLLDSPLTFGEIQALALTGAAELSQRWVAQMPEVHPHMAAGCGIELVVTLRPSAALSLRLVDSNGERRILAERQFSRGTEH